MGWKHKAPGMGKSRRADMRSSAYRQKMGYENATTAREAHIIPKPPKWPRPQPTICTKCERRARDCICTVPYYQRLTYNSGDKK